MDSTDFLSTVLPTQGKYCIFALKGALRKNIFVDTIESLQATAEDMSAQGVRAYFAMATFDDTGSRKVDSAVRIRALFMDLDCGWLEDKQVWKAFHSKKDAVQALDAFLKATGLDALGSPWLVDSGMGVHVHWPLAEEVTVAEWLPVARAMKAAAAHFGFPIDETVTDDAARVLGIPGTNNCKYDPPKPVLLRHRGDVFGLASIAEKLTGYAPKTPLVTRISSELALLGPKPTAETSAIAKALAGNSVTYFKDIMVRTAEGTGCGQIAHYVTNATEDGLEPLWRGVLSLTKYCEDGDKAARKLSLMHPYDIDRMQRKLAEIKGPYSCVKLDACHSGVCQTCPHWGKITNPLALGRKVAVAPPQSATQEADDYAMPHHAERPNPPRNFAYGKDFGVFHVKAAEGDEGPKHTLLVPYDMYMTRLFFDNGTYVGEFVALKDGGQKRVTFAVPTEVIVNTSECIKTLAKNSIISAGGGPADRYLAEYIRACMLDASANERTVNVPPRFGWQDDGSFATHDTVYSPHGKRFNYTFASKSIANIVSATKPKGTLENWVKVIEMMRAKAATDPMIWGQLATAGTGFGSILLHFMPPATNALTVHVCGVGSGIGKSLSQSISSSVWGAEKQYRVKVETSLTTTMQRAGFLGSLPLNIDEITGKSRELNREFMPAFILSHSAGVHKIKGSASGNLEIFNELFWEQFAHLTSNAPSLEAMMGARKHTSEGEARRLLEWELPRGYKLEWTDAEMETLQLLNENYGVAGPVFAQWCVLNQDTLKDVVAEVRAMWVATVGAKADERFWTSGVTCLVAGWILAGPKYANIVSMPVGEIVNFWISILNRTRSIISGNQQTALDVLNAYTRENHGKFVQVKSNVVMSSVLGGLVPTSNSSTREVRGRIEDDVVPGYRDYYIEIKMLKMHCADVSMGFGAFLEELQSLATVKECQRDLLAGTNGPSMRVKCIKITRPIVDAQDDGV